MELDTFDTTHVLDIWVWRSRRVYLEYSGRPAERYRSSPESPMTWHLREASSSESSGQWFAARWHLDRLIAATPRDGSLHARRGNALVQLGRWSEAAGDYAKAIEGKPDDPDLRYMHALALLGAGDRDGYRRACAAALGRFAATDAPAVAHRVVHTCVAGPDAVADATPLVRLARLAVPYSRGNDRILGAALLRSGHPEEALARFQEAGKGFLPESWDWLFLALIHHRLGDADQARQDLDKAAGQVDARDSRGGASGWQHWTAQVEAHCLRREVEALLMGAAFPADPFQK
jgi:Flp pilus assembly protein TadD